MFVGYIFTQDVQLRRPYWFRKVCNGKYFLHFHACRSEGGNLANISSYVRIMTIPVHEIRDPPKIHSDYNFWCCEKKESAGPDSSIGFLRGFSQTLNPDGVKIIS